MSSTHTVRPHSPRQTLSSSTSAVLLPRNSSSEAAAITDDGESDWLDELLLLCDDVRQSLRQSQNLGPRGEEIMAVLGEAVKGECNLGPTVDLRTIQVARLDKLLEDMVDAANHPSTRTAVFKADVMIAQSLQRQWRTRFGEPYIGLDAHRSSQLRRPSQSCLAVCLTSPRSEETPTPGAGNWKGLSEREGNEQFQVGCWWPQLACAHRDGLLCSSRDVLSAGQYGVPALPLLWGLEIILDGSDLNTSRIKIIRDGSPKDMCAALVSKVGKRIRILRGHGLHSQFAPAAGIRYDGQYKILQYGQRRRDEMYRLELTLQRCEGQIDMAELMRIPRPSQLDDWKLLKSLDPTVVVDGRNRDTVDTRALDTIQLK